MLPADSEWWSIAGVGLKRSWFGDNKKVAAVGVATIMQPWRYVIHLISDPCNPNS